MEKSFNLLLNNLPKLLIWTQFLAIKKDEPNLIKPIMKLLDQDLIESDDLLPCLYGNFADTLLRNVFINDNILSTFSGDLHDKNIKKFKNLDKELLIINRERINKHISKKRPNIHMGVTPNSELGILLGEFNRKRRHMPIRKLISKAGGLIQRIKPCFMMSPLSIAQFIEPSCADNVKFDVIIFDEASQVKPEDALGALLRGNQLVVMGDTKQLPPTAFFDAMIEIDDDQSYDLASLTDTESILHLCKRSFPTKMLRWHYRSRHESLIAVSNHEFYDNRLLIYPSPCNDSDKLGLKFEYIPDSIYDYGSNAGNKEEAKAVVQKVIEHYNKYGTKKSIGVGTFNVKQKTLIDNYLEIERKKDKNLEKYFSESIYEKFFVKNLETIQGDERDVILVSVGFGFDENGVLKQNFGPVNRNGGERRLNVLLTRAKERCVIFSNFKHSDLKIQPNASKGLRALKTFLEYADTGMLVSNEPPREESESPFEESVYQFLIDEGYDVHKQVGCAGFRIDLAIVNTKYPGKYLIGIECDGATYHSSLVARDRDRLRQQVLEGLGWRIYRIWSTDWYRNRDMTMQKLIKQ